MSRSIVPVLLIAGFLCATTAGGVGLVVFGLTRPTAPSARTNADVSPSAQVTIDQNGVRANVQASPETKRQDAEAKLLRDVAGHPFWKVKVTEPQVDKLLGLMDGQKRDTCVFVDENFAQYIRDGVLYFRSIQYPMKQLLPDTMSQRCIRLDLCDWDTRPSRFQLLDALKRLLDEADFR